MTIRTASESSEPGSPSTIEGSSRSPTPLSTSETDTLEAKEIESHVPHEEPPPYDSPPYTDISWNGNETECRKAPAADDNAGNQGIAGEVGRDFAHLIGSALKLSGSIPLGLSRTFHEIPKLYGDETVRKYDPVTDMQSGFRTAGEVLGLGLYDGVSGFFLQPYNGAMNNGVAGFFTGFGKGLGGIVCKPVEAATGFVGYSLTGVAKDCQKVSGRS